MARHDTTVKTPSNLLINFNPFDILEPQKCNTVPAVDKLIDVGDFPLHKDVNASLLAQKSSYDLVDLLENVFVTPQDIKIKNNDIIGVDLNDSDSNSTTISSGFDSCASISSGFDSGASVSSGFDCCSVSSGAENISKSFNRNDSGISFNDEAFKHFCDKIEFGEKIDWTNGFKPHKEYDEKKQRVLTPKLVKEDELDPEDVIYEVLSEKTNEKRLLDEIKNSAATVYKNDATLKIEIPKLKVLNSPNIDLKLPEKKILNTNEFATPSKIKTKTDTVEVSRSNLKVLNEPKIEFRTSEKKEAGCCQNCKHSNSSNNKTEIDIMYEISRLKLNNNLYYNKNIYKYTPSSFNANVTDSDFRVVAIKKNEKEYKKKNIKKPERLTSTYSDGADFDEKLKVLPQIMARIHARKAYLQEKSLLKRRLVLDGGKKTNVNQNNNDKDGGGSVTNFDRSSSDSNGVKKCCHCSLNTDINSTDKDVIDHTFGEVNPTVLMEDCNKERLAALKRDQKFKAFIVSGK